MLHIFFITESLPFSLIFLYVVTMKSVVLDVILDLPSIVSVSIYDTKSVHFFSMCCKSIKWVQKTRQEYEPKSDKVCDAHFLHVNVNDLHNHNLNSDELSDPLCNVYWVTNECVSTSCGVTFSFGSMAQFLSMHTLFISHFVNVARWSSLAIISFGVYFNWKILTPQILEVTIIWFRWFAAEAS